MDCPVYFGSAADQWIDLARFSLGVEIDSKLVKRGFFLCAAFLGLLAALGLRFFCALRPFRLQLAAAFADAMADIADCIQAAHILLLQEIDCVAVTFTKECHQNIRASYRVFARGLHMQDRALNHALETGGRLRVRAILSLQRLIFLVEILLHDLAQLSKVYPASCHDLRGIFVVDQRKQQML